MGKGFSKQNWMWGFFGAAACSMLSFSSSAYAGTAYKKSPEVLMQQYGSITIKGVVKDANGEPVIGASVKMIGGKAGNHHRRRRTLRHAGEAGSKRRGVIHRISA